jgi:transketolase
MIQLVRQFEKETLEMRRAYAQALIQSAGENERILTIDCDLASSMGTGPFAGVFPGRAFNIGIQEANACSMAAGLSAVGFIPFVHSFATFISRRICDQVFVSCAYADLNVKLIGGDAGVSAAFNGGTHMAFEDVGILRVIPNITIVEAADSSMMKLLIPLLIRHYGVCYLRMSRRQVLKVYDALSDIKLGQALVLREGEDITLIGSGIMVAETLKAAEMLQAEGISARVVDMFTIKPIDEHCVVESAKLTGAVLTAENHSITGGLGSAVAEVLAEQYPVPMERTGARGFGEVGPADYLMERFGLTAEAIYQKAKVLIARKKAQGGTR